MYYDNIDSRSQDLYYQNILQINHQIQSFQDLKQNKFQDKKQFRNSFQPEIDLYGFSEPNYKIIESFKIKDFDFPGLPESEKIKIFSASQKAYIIITVQDRIFRWKFNDQNQAIEYFLPKEGFKKKVQEKISSYLKDSKIVQSDQKQLDKVYQDYYSNHCILFDSQQNYYYLNFNSENIKRLLLLNNYKIKSLAFDDREDNTETIQFIAGTEDGEIFLGNLEKKHEEYELTCKSVYKKVDKIKSIHHLRFLTFEQNNQDIHYLIIAGTNSGFFYFFQTSQQVLQMEDIFKLNEDNFFEIPQPYSHLSLIDVSYSKDSRRALSFAYTNGNGIINIKLPNKYQSLNSRFLSTLEYLNCQKKETSNLYDSQLIMNSIPEDILLTEYHYCILHQNSLTIYSMITQQIVEYYELKQQNIYFKLVHEEPHNFYICSEVQLKKVCYENENVNIWKHYQEIQNLQLAYAMCQEVNASETEYIAGLYADDLFNKGKYIDAIKVYSESNKSFEEIFLKLVQIDQQETRNALEYYLKLLLGKYDPETQKIQISILQAWLIELLVSQTKLAQDNVKMSLIEDENVDSPQSVQSRMNQDALEQASLRAQSKLQQFLYNNQHELDQNLVFQILQQHGMIDTCLSYAENQGKFEMILLHNINESNYKGALDLIERLQINKIREIMFKYCHIFFQTEPEMTKDIFINKIKIFEPTKILGSLYNIPKDKQQTAIKMLEYCIDDLNNEEQSIHNSYIFFLAENQQIENLEKYLSKQKTKFDHKQKIHFQYDFALKIFQKNQIYSSMIIIYGMMKLYSEAVNLALEQNMLSTAKEFAKRTDIGDILQKKKLYMQIVNHLLKNEKQNIQEIVNLTKEADDILKIDEIIHRFDPNLKIEIFQGNICEQLQKYNKEIDFLKQEMENLSKQSEDYERDLISMNNNIIQFDTHKKCDFCKTFLLENRYQFFLFPCHHGFHSICIIKILTDYGMLQNKQMEELSQIQRKIGNLRDEYFKLKQNDEEKQTSFLDLFSDKNQNNSSEQNSSNQQQRINQIQEQIDKLKKQYDKILGSECIQCCNQTVESIIAPYQNDQEWNYNL